jgi:hypothetical protein
LSSLFSTWGDRRSKRAGVSLVHARPSVRE